MNLNISKNLFLIYLPYFLWIVLMVFARYYLIPASIMMIFLGLIFIPGFSLARILKIEYQDDRYGNLILFLALGLEFNFLLALMAIIFGLTITVLLNVYLAIFGLIFVLAFVLDLLKPFEIKPVNFDLKKIFQAKNLIYVLLGVLFLTVLITIDANGANFNGDPFYNLAIIRKAFDGQPLSMQDLSWNKYSVHPAFALPIWHIFLALLTKILRTNIFIIYQEIPASITLLATIVWYWLFLKILPNRKVAVLATMLAIIYYFGANGYLFTRLPVPDTLNELFLMPLAIALVIKYIFDPKANYKHLILLTLFTFLMGVVHWNHYFQFLFIIALFVIIYSIFFYKSADFKQVFKKIILASFGNVILSGLAFLYLQAKSGTVAEYLDYFPDVKTVYRNDEFIEFDPFLKYAYLFLSTLLVFVKKYRQSVFVFALFLIGPIIFNFPGLREFLTDHLSTVFVKRFYANTSWPFVIWALIIGFILILIDRLIIKITKTSNTWRYLIDTLMALLLIIAVFLQIKFMAITNFYRSVFSSQANDFLNRNYLWLIPFILLVAIIFYFLIKYRPHLKDIFVFSDFKNEFIIFILMAFLIIFLASPAFGHFRIGLSKGWSQKHFIAPIKDPTFDILDPNKFGGMDVVDFISKNIPPKADFDSNSANYVLPLLVDIYTVYTFDPNPVKRYQKIYDPNISEEKRMQIVREGRIEYILYVFSDPYQKNPNLVKFDDFKSDFTKIYSTDQAAIYKVN